MNNSNKNIRAINNNKTIDSEDKLDILPSIFAATRSGLIGFLVVFSLILISKFLFNSINGFLEIASSTRDLVISSWGFLVISFIVFTSKNRT